MFIKVNFIPTKVMFGFICKYICGELQTSDETSETFWIKKEEFLNYITVSNLIKRFEAYLTFKGDVQYLEYITKPEYELKLERSI